LSIILFRFSFSPVPFPSFIHVSFFFLFILSLTFFHFIPTFYPNFYLFYYNFFSLSFLFLQPFTIPSLRFFPLKHLFLSLSIIRDHQSVKIDIFVFFEHNFFLRTNFTQLSPQPFAPAFPSPTYLPMTKIQDTGSQSHFPLSLKPLYFPFAGRSFRFIFFPSGKSIPLQSLVARTRRVFAFPFLRQPLYQARPPPLKTFLLHFLYASFTFFICFFQPLRPTANLTHLLRFACSTLLSHFPIFFRLQTYLYTGFLSFALLCCRLFIHSLK
jgi:hypothetical protein